MDVTYKTVRSTVSPDLLDTTSSATTVYLRKDVEQKTETDETSGQETTYFEYKEAKLTKAEYQLYLVSKAAEEQNTETQMALAELAEAILNS